MNAIEKLWHRFAASKRYREEFVTTQVKRGIPFQIRTLMKQKGLSQEELAKLSGLTQGVVSRAANPNYGNLTLNTIIRIAAGFDVAFVGKFVPFRELGDWFLNLSEAAVSVPSFNQDTCAEPKGPQSEKIERMLTTTAEAWHGQIIGAAMEYSGPNRFRNVPLEPPAHLADATSTEEVIRLQGQLVSDCIANMRSGLQSTA